MIEEVYGSADRNEEHMLSAYPIGKKNDAFAQYFIGQIYIVPI